MTMAYSPYLLLHGDLNRLEASMDAQFLAMNEKFDAKFDAVIEKFDAVIEKFDAVIEKFDVVNEKLAAIDKRLAVVEDRVNVQTPRTPAESSEPSSSLAPRTGAETVLLSALDAALCLGGRQPVFCHALNNLGG